MLSGSVSPTFESVRREAYALLGDVQDILRTGTADRPTQVQRAAILTASEGEDHG